MPVDGGIAVRTTTIVAVTVLAILYQPALAVIIAGGDGTGNDTSGSVPFDFPYWDAIGKISRPTDPEFVDGGTAVYLGDGHVLTARHIHVIDQPTTVTFCGDVYDIDPGSWDRIGPDAGTTDLTMFRLSGDYPDVTPVSYADIPEAAMPNGTTAYMFGFGRNRAVDETLWYIKTSDNPDTWSTTPIPGYNMTKSGFYWAGGKTVRWGANSIAMNNLDLNNGYGITRSYRVIFNETGGDNEAQAATGDSGGPVFVYDDGDWKLIGITLAVAKYGSDFLPFPNNQPGSTAVYGNHTYFAELSYYRDEIVLGAAVPGDADLDGDVDDCDLTLLLVGWGDGGREWGDGDFNKDGDVNDFDLSLLLDNWGIGTALQAETVPEPGTLGLLVVGWILGLLRPRRMQRDQFRAASIR